MAVIGFLSNPGTVRIRSRAAWYLSERRRISCSISSRCFSNSSMWLRHWRSFTACSGEIAPSTAAWISSIGVLQRLSTKGVTSNKSPGCSRIYSVIEREDFPNTSLNTSSSLRLDTVRQFWARFFSPVIIQMSLKRYLTKSLKWRMSAGGIKEGFTISHMNKSHIHLASLRSVLFPFCGLVYLGWERITETYAFSRTLKTGIQYLPVDSIQTSVQWYLASQSDNSFSPLEKDEKRVCL